MISLTFTLAFVPIWTGKQFVRAMCCTDASPFMESIDSHWATVAACTEDAADLGDAKELDDDGDEALSDDEDQAEDDNDL